MNDDLARRLEAWFDGEVSPAEHAAMEELLARDPAARAYVDRLNRLREGLAGAFAGKAETGRAWALTWAGIIRSDNRRASRVLSFPQLVAATAAIMVVGMAIWYPLRDKGAHAEPEAYGIESSVYMVETDLEGAMPVVYIDQPSGWTVVWVIEAESPDKG